MGFETPARECSLWPGVITDGRFNVSEDEDLLVLSRKVGERILIGDQIAITIVKVAQGGVRIGVEAPAELAIVREELAQRLNQIEQQATRRAALKQNGVEQDGKPASDQSPTCS